jgi:hypothetical protein
VAERLFPGDVRVLDWLGQRLTRQDLHEAAAELFARAAKIAVAGRIGLPGLVPAETEAGSDDDPAVRFLLLAASSYRRAQQPREAVAMLKQLHRLVPGHRACLQNLAMLVADLDGPQAAEEFDSKLAELDAADRPVLSVPPAFAAAPSRPASGRLGAGSPMLPSTFSRPVSGVARTEMSSPFSAVDPTPHKLALPPTQSARPVSGASRLSSAQPRPIAAAPPQAPQDDIWSDGDDDLLDF